MLFQVASDLHLDLLPESGTVKLDSWMDWPELQVHGSVGHESVTLILAGDIAKWIWTGWTNFLEICLKRFDQVLMVEGNHEWYGLGLDAKSVTFRNQKVTELESVFPRFRVLNCSSWVNKEMDLTILGCTLWSQLTKGLSESDTKRIADFQTIPGMTRERYDELHQQHKTWLLNEIATCRTAHLLVVTHHPPLKNGVSAPKYERHVDATRSAKCNDLGPLLYSRFRSIPLTWIFGHSHWRADFTIGSHRFITNAHGYHSEQDHLFSEKCSAKLL